MKKIQLVLTNGVKIVSILPDREADKLMDQYYKLCEGELSGPFELTQKDESDKLENLLLPLGSILYISCRDT
jgi:hypothetical protein